VPIIQTIRILLSRFPGADLKICWGMLRPPLFLNINMILFSVPVASRGIAVFVGEHVRRCVCVCVSVACAGLARWIVFVCVCLCLCLCLCSQLLFNYWVLPDARSMAIICLVHLAICALIPVRATCTATPFVANEGMNSQPTFNCHASCSARSIGCCKVGSL
jgi:hypothetical protein